VAAGLARRLLKELAEPFPLDGQDLQIGASIGITMFPLDGADAQQLLKNADLAMYRAKAVGRANYQFFKQEMNLAFLRRKALERDLRRAVDNGDLELFYQPQVEAQRGSLVGAEALLRWSHPERGPVPPSEFIPVAEECGLIVPLGNWALQAACARNKAWQEAGWPPIRVAVNLSAAQFLRRDLVADVARALEGSGLTPDHLELEITESLLMRDTEATIGTLRRLSDLGVRIALDDFGTGYSSMSYLRRFPVQKIKIDRSFVIEVTGNRSDTAIVRAVGGLARDLGLTVAAEGVETQEQADRLRELGCHELQGYHFGRPAAAARFERRLRDLRGQRDVPRRRTRSVTVEEPGTRPALDGAA
jgi:predicted signal transduction protein with EAL and GGDEF domain